MVTGTLLLNALCSVYFGSALMLSCMAHDMGASPMAVGLLGALLVIVPAVRS